MKNIIIVFILLMVGSALFQWSFPEQRQEEKNTQPQFNGGSYQEHDPEETITSGDIVLFFHADRCPTCVHFEKTIMES
jgi:hypothetical protein